tara:strand:- start:198 stop:443 length:246 start_codon:yes stop_codon:yes gene_type:complete
MLFKPLCCILHTLDGIKEKQCLKIKIRKAIFSIEILKEHSKIIISRQYLMERDNRLEIKLLLCCFDIEPAMHDQDTHIEWI